MSRTGFSTESIKRSNPLQDPKVPDYSGLAAELVTDYVMLADPLSSRGARIAATGGKPIL